MSNDEFYKVPSAGDLDKANEILLELLNYQTCSMCNKVADDGGLQNE